jgi:NADPH2:quinone reductase
LRAAFYEAYGSAAEVLRVGDLPVPSVGPDDVLIRIAVSGINPGDTKARRGVRGPFPSTYVIPHSAGAGVIERVGDRVDASWVGRDVWCFNAQYRSPFGTAAEFCSTPLSNVRLLPEGMSYRDGAMLGVAPMTAMAGVVMAMRARIPQDPVHGVLVLGASGGVGAAAVQICSRMGMDVVAVTSAEHLETVSRLGAGRVLCRDEDSSVEDGISALGRGLDLILTPDLDAVLGFPPSAFAQGVEVAVYGSRSRTPSVDVMALQFRNACLRFLYLYELPVHILDEAADQLTALAAEAPFNFPRAPAFPLEAVGPAHDHVESVGSRGGATLDVGAPQDLRAARRRVA